MGDEATTFKDGATEELENFLMRQVQAAVRSELGPVVDDLSDDVRRAVQDLRTELDRSDKESKESLKKLEVRLLEKIESVQERIGQVSEQLKEDRTFFKESFDQLSTGEQFQQLLQDQSDLRTELDRCDKESKESLKKLEARLLEKMESVQERIGSQVSERLNEDRTFLKESFDLLSTGEQFQQLLQDQSDTRSTVLKGVKLVLARMTTNDESRVTELKLISETLKKLQLLVSIALGLAGLAAATSAAVLLWNLLK